MRTLHLDWRGRPDLSRSADFYSIAATHESRPVTGNPKGCVLVGISSTIYLDPNGVPVNRPYNADLYAAVLKAGALSHLLDPDPNGYRAQLFDITKRGMLKAWLDLIAKHFSWADGFHIDWFTAWSWEFPEMAPMDEAWDNALVALANALRASGKLVIGQQYHLTNPVMATNGAFCEQYPTFNRYTIESHTSDLRTFREFTARVDPREVVWVQELREYAKFAPEYVQQIKAWAVVNGVVLSFGRDALAGVGL